MEILSLFANSHEHTFQYNEIEWQLENQEKEVDYH